MRKLFVLLLPLLFLGACAGKEPLVQTSGVEAKEVYENRGAYVERVQNQLAEWDTRLYKLRLQQGRDLNPTRFEQTERRISVLEDRIRNARRELIQLKLATREEWMVHPRRIDAAVNSIRQDMEKLRAE